MYHGRIHATHRCRKATYFIGFVTVTVMVCVTVPMLDGTFKLSKVSRVAYMRFSSDKSHTEDTYVFTDSEARISAILDNDIRPIIGHTCQQLFSNDIYKNSLNNSTNKSAERISNQQYQNMTQNCEMFKQQRGYLDSTFTETERTFPIAYSIVAYKDIDQLERLLRAIYRPQNVYCIHMDSKTLLDDYTTINSITSCFDNVFIPDRHVNVIWGQFSVLEAELVCMKELLARTHWKYYINLTGQEFPLKTNLEIVQILRAMKGANLVDGTVIRAKKDRWEKAGSPPHNIRPVKGSVHVAVNRQFVQFAIYDNRSVDFLKWLNNTIVPDETFFASLNHNPHLGINGSFIGDPEEYPEKPTFTRYKNWILHSGVWTRQCGGKVVREICILGLKDLVRLKDSMALFANKFYVDYQPLAYDCLEELIYNRTREQYLNKTPIDISFYSNLDQIKLQVIT